MTTIVIGNPTVGTPTITSCLLFTVNIHEESAVAESDEFQYLGELLAYKPAETLAL